MTNWKEKWIHSKVEENNISRSKSVIDRSAKCQKYANCEFTYKPKEHEEIIQTLKFNTQNSCLNSQVIRKLANNNWNESTSLRVFQRFCWVTDKSSTYWTNLWNSTFRPIKSLFCWCYIWSLTSKITNVTHSNILM